MKNYNLFIIQLYLLIFPTNDFPLGESTTNDEFDYPFFNSSNEFPEVHNQSLKTITNLTADSSILSDLTDVQRKPKAKILTLLIASFIVAVFGVLVNARVFYIVWIKSKQKSRYYI